MIVIAVLALCSHPTAVLGDAPVSVSADFDVYGHKNEDHVIQLRPNVRIPDNGELNWPIFVPDDITVKNARVTVTGLYHPHASDLKIQLRHNDRVVDLINGCGEKKHLGKPDPFPHPNSAGPEFPPSTGTGFRYVFEDAIGANLALGRNTSQSSTMFQGASSRAVDGDVSGHFSLGSVTHTGDIVAPDPNPWWQVALDEEQVVGSIRIWNREDELETDEVQVVTTDAAGVLAGTFTLSFRHHNATHTSAPIAVNAVALGAQEDTSVTTAGVGLGESMQSKLQAMPNVGQVFVRRSPADARGGYSWTITFLSEPGNVEQLQVVDNSITSPGASITIRTPIQGTSVIWQTEEGEQVAVSGRLVPAYVMLLPNATDFNGTLAEVLAQATWSKKLVVNQRQTLLRLPTNTTGAFVRIQLESDDFLSLSEVQVYREEADTMCTFRGGSPFPKGKYKAVQSLQGGLVDVPSLGEWVLTLRDMAAVQVANQGSSLPDVNEHGYGGLQWWCLELYDVNGTIHKYYADVTFQVTTLPTYGSLYNWDATAAVKSGGFAIVEGRQQYTGQCYESCRGRFNVGNRLSTNHDGSVTSIHRITAEDHAFTVLYVPNEGYLGSDYFTFVTFVGVQRSERGKVTVHTRNCRGTLLCTNEFFDDLLLERRD